MCGARRSMPARSTASVSPVRTAARRSAAARRRARLASRADLGERRLEVSLDVVRERAQRRDVDRLDVRRASSPASARRTSRSIDQQERGERLARAGRRGDQHVAAARDRGPARGLRPAWARGSGARTTRGTGGLRSRPCVIASSPAGRSTPPAGRASGSGSGSRRPRRPCPGCRARPSSSTWPLGCGITRSSIRLVSLHARGSKLRSFESSGSRIGSTFTKRSAAVARLERPEDALPARERGHAPTACSGISTRMPQRNGPTAGTNTGWCSEPGVARHLGDVLVHAVERVGRLVHVGEEAADGVLPARDHLLRRRPSSPRARGRAARVSGRQEPGVDERPHQQDHRGRPAARVRDRARAGDRGALAGLRARAARTSSPARPGEPSWRRARVVAASARRPRASRAPRRRARHSTATSAAAIASRRAPASLRRASSQLDLLEVAPTREPLPDAQARRARVSVDEDAPSHASEYSGGRPQCAGAAGTPGSGASSGRISRARRRRRALARALVGQLSRRALRGPGCAARSSASARSSSPAAEQIRNRNSARRAPIASTASSTSFAPGASGSAPRSSARVGLAQLARLGAPCRDCAPTTRVIRPRDERRQDRVDARRLRARARARRRCARRAGARAARARSGSNTSGVTRRSRPRRRPKATSCRVSERAVAACEKCDGPRDSSLRWDRARAP